MAIVTAPLIIATDDAGKYVYLYQGTEVPENISKDELDRLSDYIDGGVKRKSSDNK